MGMKLLRFLLVRHPVSNVENDEDWRSDPQCPVVDVVARRLGVGMDRGVVSLKGNGNHF